MRDLLLVLWLVSIGADRVDFLAGYGPFLLTPFLVLSPLVLGVELLSAAGARREIHLPRRALEYLLVATLFLCVVLLSVFFSSEVGTSGARGALLSAQVYATFLVAVVMANRPDPSRLLVAGAYGGIALSLVVSLAQVALWFAGSLHASPHTVVNLTPATFGPFAPRVSGVSLDANRGAALFFIYTFVLYLFARPSRARSGFLVLGVIFMLATLSRSILLAAALCALWLFLSRTDWKLGRAPLLGLTLAGAGVTAIFLLVPPLQEAMLRFSEPFLDRLALGDESSSIHIALIERGWEVGRSSVGHALFGIGFGNAASVLHDFFPGSKYANFHSLYATLLAESGVFALVLGVVLLVYPLIRSRSYAPLVAGLVLFNVFYQTILEPLFWFVLAAAWFQLGVAGPAGAAPADEAPREPLAPPVRGAVEGACGR